MKIRALCDYIEIMSFIDDLKKAAISVGEAPARQPEKSKLTHKDLEKRPWLEQVKQEVPPLAKYVPRTPEGLWQPGGGSPNPGGRPEGPMRLIAALTGNGEELVLHAIRLLRGDLTTTQEIVTRDGEVRELIQRPSIRDQSEARTWLGNRLWGKAPETVKIEDVREAKADEIPMQDLPPDVFEMKFALEQRMAQLRAARSAVVDAELVPDPAADTGGVKSALKSASDTSAPSESNGPAKPVT